MNTSNAPYIRVDREGNPSTQSPVIHDMNAGTYFIDGHAGRYESAEAGHEAINKVTRTTSFGALLALSKKAE